MNVRSLDCPLLSGFLLASLLCHWLADLAGMACVMTFTRWSPKKGHIASEETDGVSERAE